MTIPVFILAGQSNASALSNEIETALDERYGAGNYEFLSVFADGAPLTRKREDEPDWSDPTELNEELTTGLIDVLNEDLDHVIGGIIWVHGEADTYYAGGAAGYGEDLEDLIDDLRNDVSDAMGDRETGLDVAPVTILELSENAPAAPDREAWDRVISEQLAVAEADPLVTTLDPDTVAEDADVSQEAMFQDNLHYAGNFQYLLAGELVETMSPPILFGIVGEDEQTGSNANATLIGTNGADTLAGGNGDDVIYGLDGYDILIGGEGNDTLTGGTSTSDMGDEIYGGAGNDIIRGGYGNDELRGDAGDDNIAGGFGADLVIGGAGDDVLAGSALGDLLFGGDGMDFFNGGFGHDRVNGGAGADRFFHIGVVGHGSDWIQDYDSAEGDTLVFGIASADGDDFQVNFAHTASAEGERSGNDDIAEGFVIYRPTGQIMWALVDGGGQDEINIVIDGVTYDLLG